VKEDITKAKASARPDHPRKEYPDPRRLKVAVRKAIRVYKKTGRMRDAALVFASYGFPVFPVSRAKVPIPRMDRDADGKEIPGTGGFKKATCDPDQINEWWIDNPDALIGLPMGAKSGLWCLDIDTDEDHKNGVASWRDLAATHDPIETREHRSATGGPHLIFPWDAAAPIRCSKGALPEGMEVKGEGGYIVVPPSMRKGRAYTVYRDIDPQKAPDWLTELIWQGPVPPSWDATSYGSFEVEKNVDVDELTDAVRAIPNPTIGWDEWKNMALRIIKSVGAVVGEPIFREWSQKCPDYPRGGEAMDRKAWQEAKRSPPNRTGSNKIFAMAREHGWVRWLSFTPAASLQDDASLTPIEAARDQMRQHYREFLERVAVPEPERSDPYRIVFDESHYPEYLIAQAMRVDTGVGKTQLFIEEMAAWLARVGPIRPLIYAVPRHKLGQRIAQQFAAQGIHARVFYGRDRIDPNANDPNIKMCRNLKAVELAYQAHADVTKACCKNGKQCCAFLKICGYMTQQEDAEHVQVWIVAADMLFHPIKVFGEVAAVIIDEGFWNRGVHTADEKIPKVALPSLILEGPTDFETEIGQRDYLRNILAQALKGADDGPVQRRHLTAALTPHACSQAISLEYKLMPEFTIQGSRHPAACGWCRRAACAGSNAAALPRSISSILFTRYYSTPPCRGWTFCKPIIRRLIPSLISRCRCRPT
jgi:hypothetical protein